MPCSKSGDAGIGLGCSLANEIHAAALIEPGSDATVERAITARGENGDLTAGVSLGRVVLLHRRFTGGELLLDLAALVAADPGELFGEVGEFIVIQLELSLGYIEVIGVGSRAVGLFERGGKNLHLAQVFLDERLDLGNFFLKHKSVAGECASLEGSLAKGESKGLINLVISQPGRLVREGLLFGGDSEGSERLDSLPRTLVDQILPAGRTAVGFEERHVNHGATRPPRCREAEDEEGGGNCYGETTEFLHSLTLHAPSVSFKTPLGLLRMWNLWQQDICCKCQSYAQRLQPKTRGCPAQVVTGI
ncbi:hypothetical protein RBB78_13060 [Tunturiibacter empetritectus]|uniref:hypothetical protein n=1 Tax=Tunturiibacter empetritectus TaxID=3069691 RepID=UPI003D9BAD21